MNSKAGNLIAQRAVPTAAAALFSLGAGTTEIMFAVFYNAHASAARTVKLFLSEADPAAFSDAETIFAASVASGMTVVAFPNEASILMEAGQTLGVNASDDSVSVSLFGVNR